MSNYASQDPPEQSLALAGNRVLSYAIYGAPTAARTIFYFHGFPASRTEAGLEAPRPTPPP